MKIVKYQAMGTTMVGILKEDGTIEKVYRDLLYDVIRPYSPENEELAMQEAYQGHYTIEDNEGPEAAVTDADRIRELEEALALLLSGVTE